MNIALVHDWITGIAGDVRVLKQIHEMYPEAPIYCLYRDKKFTDEFLPKAQVISSNKFFKPFLPAAIESIDLSDYDIVISVGSIFSKGLILRPKTYHINYCHSPTRQVWDLSSETLHATRFALHKKMFLHFFRIWDRQASTRVDQFIANSEHVRARIKKYYKRDSIVVYPPVETKNEKRKTKNNSYFLIISRLYKHKNVDIAIKAFNKLGMNLVIIGDGPERKRLEAMAGPTVHLLGSLSDALCTMHYALCTAFLLPQEEDFGITAIEAMAYGKPVLALNRGGALEYIQEGVNGLFFDDPHEAVLADGIRRIKEINFDSEKIKASAQKFSCQKFQSSFSNIITQLTR